MDPFLDKKGKCFSFRLGSLSERTRFAGKQAEKLSSPWNQSTDSTGESIVSKCRENGPERELKTVSFTI